MQNIEQGISNFENGERIGIDNGGLFAYKWVAAPKPKVLRMVNAAAEGANHFD
jgi:hypothetical protein